MAKRKRQSKGPKDLDVSKPITASSIDLSKIGGEDDCFGNIHDPKDNECKMCGDSALCVIIMGQTNRHKREKVEKGNEFRDLKKLGKIKKKKK